MRHRPNDAQGDLAEPGQRVWLSLNFDRSTAGELVCIVALDRPMIVWNGSNTTISFLAVDYCGLFTPGTRRSALSRQTFELIGVGFNCAAPEPMASRVAD